VLLYELLVGHSPFLPDGTDGPPTEQAIVARITQGTYSLPPFVSKAAGDLVGKLLRLRQSERIGPAAVLQHPWMLRYCGSVAKGGATEGSSSDELIALTELCLAPWPSMRSAGLASSAGMAAAVAARDAAYTKATTPMLLPIEEVVAALALEDKAEETGPAATATTAAGDTLRVAAVGAGVTRAAASTPGRGRGAKRVSGMERMPLAPVPAAAAAGGASQGL